MSSHNSAYLIVFSLLAYASVASAQNEGIGTFSSLVGDALQNPPEPQPTPVLVPERTFTGEKELVPVSQPQPFLSQPTLALEYDYRRNQQRALNGFSTDINEAHSAFSFVLVSTKFAFDYVHIWSEASNDIGDKQSVASNGIKVTATQPIGNNLVFSFPVFYKNGDGDAVISTVPQTFGMDTFTINPLLILLVKPNILKDAQGKAEPNENQPLTLSFSPGYRVSLTEKNDIHPISPDVDGWTGIFSLLAGVEYAPKQRDGERKGENKWKIGGSVTWNHITNFYFSTVAPRPDDNFWALAGSVVYTFLTFKDSSGNYQPKFAMELDYEYDGFNRDFYQHTVTIVGRYRFW
jgi:hypothetical protein